jgi:hypothetical protein
MDGDATNYKMKNILFLKFCVFRVRQWADLPTSMIFRGEKNKKIMA